MEFVSVAELADVEARLEGADVLRRISGAAVVGVGGCLGAVGIVVVEEAEEWGELLRRKAWEERHFRLFRMV